MILLIDTDFLKSLVFANMDHRELGVADPYDGTCT